MAVIGTLNAFLSKFTTLAGKFNKEEYILKGYVKFIVECI